MYRDVAYHGGILATGFVTGWHITEIRGHKLVAQAGPHHPNLGSWDLAWNIINHQTYDDFWKERNPDFGKNPMSGLQHWHSAQGRHPFAGQYPGV